MANSKSPWYHIAQAPINVLDHIVWHINNGKDTLFLFWFHNWSPNGVLCKSVPRIFALISNPLLIVFEAWNRVLGIWEMHSQHPWLQREIEAWTSLTNQWHPPHNLSSNDVIKLMLSFDDLFNVKSLKLHMHNILPDNTYRNVGNMWSSLWPKKCKFFIWTIIHNGLNSMENRQARHPSLHLNPNWCVLCRNSMEIVEHMFINSSFSKTIWIASPIWL